MAYTFNQKNWVAGEVITANGVNRIEECLGHLVDEKQNTLYFDAVPTAGSPNLVDSNGIYNAIKALDISTIDRRPTSNSKNAVQSRGIYEALLGKQDLLIFDSTPKSNSSNPVTSQGIYQALNLKQNNLTFDSTPISDSNNPVTSKGIYQALSLKQNNLTFDSIPDSGSNNPVTSSGIRRALNLKQDNLTFDSTPILNSSNPVTSEGIYISLQNLLGEVNNSLDTLNYNFYQELNTKQNKLTFDNTPKNNSNNPVTSNGIYDALQEIELKIPNAQVQSDWNVIDSTSKAYIKNKPSLGTAAYKNIPSSGNASSSQIVLGSDTRLTDSRNAKDVYNWAKQPEKPTYSYNELTDLPTIPTKTSQLTNDSGFLIAHQDISGKADKSTTVSNVTYDTTNKKITKTINGTTSNVVSTATLKTDMSLSNVENKSSATIRSEITSSNITIALGFTPLDASLKGANSGIAELDSNGKVPSSQLPSYVDDVLEYTTKTKFPSTGETGKIYVDITTNKTYRWSGSDYIEISASLALGTTSSTAYRGDYGNAAYAHAVTNKGSAFSSGLYKITTNSEGHVIAATVVAKSDITGLGIPGSDTTYTFDGTYNASTNKAATVSTVTNAIAALNISDKADKNATVSTVSYDATSKKITKTINGTTTDVISVATLKTDMSLNNVENKSSATIRDEITSSNITTALGFIPLNASLKGANNGVAELDSNGKIPSYQLPASIDAILEYNSFSNFPSQGESGKIYVALDTNKSYRWSGTQYTEISSSISLGEVQGTAYEGHKGKANALAINNLQNNKANKSTTISGYGIIDAKIENGTITLGNNTIQPIVDNNYNHTDNNFTNEEKNKLAQINIGAEKNIQSDWNITDINSDAYIKNKPEWIYSDLSEEVYSSNEKIFCDGVIDHICYSRSFNPYIQLFENEKYGIIINSKEYSNLYLEKIGNYYCFIGGVFHSLNKNQVIQNGFGVVFRKEGENLFYIVEIDFTESIINNFLIFSGDKKAPLINKQYLDIPEINFTIENNNNLVTSGAVYTELIKKQNNLINVPEISEIKPTDYIYIERNQTIYKILASKLGTFIPDESDPNAIETNDGNVITDENGNEIIIDTNTTDTIVTNDGKIILTEDQRELNLG